MSKDSTPTIIYVRNCNHCRKLVHVDKKIATSEDTILCNSCRPKHYTPQNWENCYSHGPEPENNIVEY